VRASTHPTGDRHANRKAVSVVSSHTMCQQQRYVSAILFISFDILIFKDSMLDLSGSEVGDFRLQHK
jgi:hypothetical protein